MPFRIAFVCSGNICRSPSAEAVLRRMVDERGLGDRIVVDSFGIGAWHVGQPVDPRALNALHHRGYDLDHVARMIDADDIAERDLVIAIDRGHEQDLRAMAYTVEDAAKVRLLRSYDPGADGQLDVPDPYYGGASGFDRVLDMIEAGCRGLLDEVTAAVRSEPASGARDTV
jgi:protein-tyrosine phosphatase